jgi:protein-disulfide isomerase
MPDDGLARLSSPVGERDHAQGDEVAAVTLVEYGDYECPYCRAAVPIVQDLQQVMGDRLRFVFRHFPLTERHPHAQHAAEAAEAAAAQGQFFKMHFSLFEHQQALDDGHLKELAADLDLDTTRFSRELDARTYRGRVIEDFQSGRSSGVNGTPTFYLDGVRYDRLVGVREFLARIRETHPEIAV